MIRLYGRQAVQYAKDRGLEGQLSYFPIPEDQTHAVRRREWRAFKRRRAIERLHSIRDNDAEKAVTPGTFGLMLRIAKLRRRK